MFDYVFFDLDGTLTRSGDGIKRSAAHAIAQLGYPALPEAQLDAFVGPPLLESFMNFCGMDEATALRAVRLYRARFEDVGWRENAVYPGIAQLLRALVQHRHEIGHRAAHNHGHGVRRVVARVHLQPI